MKRIEICGNIASGKTTLCQQLVKRREIGSFEEFHKNPFFSDFYSNPALYSFETEVTFLFQHYHSIKKINKNGCVICDYSFILDIAYADVNLVDERHRIFLEIVHELKKEIGYPSQIIHLICPEETLLQRIIDRKREVESSITIEYLKALSEAVLFRIKDISNKVPIITIDSMAVDFRTGIEGIEELEQFK